MPGRVRGQVDDLRQLSYEGVGAGLVEVVVPAQQVGGRAVAADGDRAERGAGTELGLPLDLGRGVGVVGQDVPAPVPQEDHVARAQREGRLRCRVLQRDEPARTRQHHVESRPGHGRQPQPEGNTSGGPYGDRTTGTHRGQHLGEDVQLVSP